MKRKVIFIEDFATLKKGDLHECDGQLASHLVRIDKVAKFVDVDDNPIEDVTTADVPVETKNVETGKQDNPIEDIVEGTKKRIKKIFGKK
tara:strand:- start:145 stop:414 length:270 start_codon:yes stop_codon:yes gene_type:complete